MIAFREFAGAFVSGLLIGLGLALGYALIVLLLNRQTSGFLAGFFLAAAGFGASAAAWVLVMAGRRTGRW